MKLCKSKNPQWIFETNDKKKIVLEMVLSKNQAVTVSDMKLSTDKMGKDFHAYVCRLHIIAVDLELCIFRNRCQ